MDRWREESSQWVRETEYVGCGDYRSVTGHTHVQTERVYTRHRPPVPDVRGRRRGVVPNLLSGPTGSEWRKVFYFSQGDYYYRRLYS